MKHYFLAAAALILIGCGMIGCGMKYTTKNGNEITVSISLEDALMIGQNARLLRTARNNDASETGLLEYVTSTGVKVIIK